jgi:hypothetical protein
VRLAHVASGHPSTRRFRLASAAAAALAGAVVATVAGLGAGASPAAGDELPNLALNKATQGSVPCDTASAPAAAVSGSVADGWCSAAEKKYVQVNLGGVHQVAKMVVRHAGAAGATAAWNTRAYSVTVSTDGTTWIRIARLLNNTRDANTLNITPRNVRYVRVNVEQGAEDGQPNLARIQELEVYGAPVAGPTPDPAPNLALNQAAQGSAPCTVTSTPAAAVSGQTTDGWCSSAASKWLQVNLGGSLTISQIVVRHAASGGNTAAWNTRAYTVTVSTDGITWIQVASLVTNTSDANTLNITPRTVRYVRVNVEQGAQDGQPNIARIQELEVYA